MIKKAYTTNEAAEHCNVSFQSIIKWIESGKLKAYKTPGGHRRILLKDFKRFLAENDMPPLESLSEEEVKIMVVADNEVIRESIIEMLKKSSGRIIVESTNDVFEAGRLLELFNPKIVILGTKLGGIDGADICKKIKSDEVSKDIKVLMIVESMNGDSAAPVLNTIADGIIRRPIEYSELITNIENLLKW